MVDKTQEQKKTAASNKSGAGNNGKTQAKPGKSQSSKPSKRRVNHIHLVGGEKGGVGKTFIARCLCQYMKSQGHDYALVEADSQINDVGRIYSRQAKQSSVIRLSDDPSLRSEPDLIADLAGDNTVLVNLPSNTLDVLERWMSEVGLLSYLEEECEGGQVVKWFVSDGCHESILQLDRSIKQFDGQIPHILVLNQGRLNGRDFSYLDKSKVYKSVKEAKNLVATIEFPALETGVQYYIDSNELTLEQAQEGVQSALGIMAKQRVKTFIEVFSDKFDHALRQLDVVPRSKKNSQKSSGKNASNDSSGAGDSSGDSSGDEANNKSWESGDR